MNKLRFQKDEGTDFYKELISTLDHYFSSNNIAREGNSKMLFKIGMYFSLVILFYILMLYSASIALFFIWYMALGLAVLLTAFNVSHDAAHGVAVKSKFWNKVLFQLSFQLQGNNAYVWGKNHTESHHLYTNIEGSDIDVLNNPLVRMTNQQKLKKFHKYQFIYAPVLYLLYSINWFLFREALMMVNVTSRTIDITIPKTEVVKLVFFKLFYVFYMIVLPAMVLPFGWGVVVLAFILQHFMVSVIFVGVLGVSHLSDFVQHPVPDENNKLDMSWPKLQMQTSVDYDIESRFFNWTLGGFNAHALHHLLPNVSHIHYINIVPIFRELCEKHNITYMEMSYAKAISSHFRFLRGMGRYEDFKPRNFEG